LAGCSRFVFVQVLNSSLDNWFPDVGSADNADCSNEQDLKPRNPSTPNPHALKATSHAQALLKMIINPQHHQQYSYK
jgi:hypothetical protein